MHDFKTSDSEIISSLAVSGNPQHHILVYFLQEYLDKIIIGDARHN